MNLKCLYADIIQEIRQLQDITMHFMLILHFFQYQIFFLYLLFYWGLLLLMDLELGKNWGIPSYYKTTQLTPALYKLINHQVNISTAVSVVLPIEEEVFNAIHRNNEPSRKAV